MRIAADIGQTRRRRSMAIGAAILSLCIASSAVAAEYCVTCAGPAAMYACVVGGTPPDAPADPREQLVCIAEIAKSGGHDSCSVPRSAPKPCPGVLRIVAAPPPGATPPAPDTAAAPEAAGVPAGEPGPSAGAEEGEPEPAKPAAPPRTVEEMAKRSVETSKEGLEKAGEQVGKAGSAVGEAAKKTWNCLTSLFSDC